MLLPGCFIRIILPNAPQSQTTVGASVVLGFNSCASVSGIRGLSVAMTLESRGGAVVPTPVEMGVPWGRDDCGDDAEIRLASSWMSRTCFDVVV